MKKSTIILSAAICTLIGFCSTIYTSCKKDACSSVSCKNGGTCNEGECICPYAYTGSKCETEARSKYYNTYTGDGIDSEGDSYTGWSLVFYKSGNGSDTLGLDILSAQHTTRASLIIRLNTANDFTIVPNNNTATKLSGYGSINSAIASLTLTDSSATPPLVLRFSNMQKQ